MKKILMTAAAAVAMTSAATPAMATDTAISIVPNAEIPETCFVGAFVRGTAGAAGSDPGNASIGSDDQGVSTGLDTFSSTVDLASTSSQLLASVSAVGNVNCDVLIQTDNDFSLNNAGTGAIAYELALSSFGSASSNGDQLGGEFQTGNQTTPFTRSLSLTIPTPVDLLNQEPGTYADTIRITVAPAP